MKYFILSALLMVSVLLHSQWQGTGSIYYNGGNVGIGTSSPVNTLDVVSGTAGSMAKNYYEMASFERNADAKLGIYNSNSSLAGAGSALTFGSTGAVNANSLYPGFELQFVPASAVANTYMRFNLLQRNSSGEVNSFLADILNMYGDGRVTIPNGRLEVRGGNVLMLRPSNNNWDMQLKAVGEGNGTGRLDIYSGGAPSTAIASFVDGGNVGIGTTSPAEKLDMIGKFAVSNGIKMTGVPTSEADINIIHTSNSSSTIGFLAGSGVFSSSSGPYVGGRGNAYNVIGSQRGMLFLSGGAVSSPSGAEGSIGFYTTPGAGTGESLRLLVGRDGNIGINTSNPSEKLDVSGNIKATGYMLIGTTSLPAEDAKLAVDGNIYSKKVKVTQSGWADYVFNDRYRLRPLSEVEQYIQQHHHLPEVPSAAEVEKDGIDLGDNQATLLKKIEELTLYIIEQNKRLSALEKKLQVNMGK